MATHSVTVRNYNSAEQRRVTTCLWSCSHCSILGFMNAAIQVLGCLPCVYNVTESGGHVITTCDLTCFLKTKSTQVAPAAFFSWGILRDLILCSTPCLPMLHRVHPHTVHPACPCFVVLTHLKKTPAHLQPTQIPQQVPVALTRQPVLAANTHLCVSLANWLTLLIDKSNWWINRWMDGWTNRIQCPFT